MLRGASQRRLARQVASARAPPRRLFGAKAPLPKKDGAGGGAKPNQPVGSAPPPPAQQAPHEAGGPGFGSLAVGLLTVTGSGVMAVRFNESANRFAREKVPGLYDAFNQVIPLDAGSTGAAATRIEAEDAGEGAQGAAEEAAPATIGELEEREAEGAASAAEGLEQGEEPAAEDVAGVEAVTDAQDEAETEAEVAAPEAAGGSGSEDADNGAEGEVEGTPIDVGGDAGDVEARSSLPEEADPKFTGVGLSAEVTHEVERLRVQALVRAHRGRGGR